MKRKPLIVIVVILVVLVALIVYSSLSGKEKIVVLETEAKRGDFEIAVMVTGELQALKEIEIQGPQALRSRHLRIHNVKIQALIEEGSVVDSGDWVATLDRSEADNSLKDILDDKERLESVFMRSKLDTTIELRNLRDNLINLKFASEEAKITLEQSKYEPPATIRQAEINLEKADRAYTQALKNYELKEKQNVATVHEARLNLERVKRKQVDMEKALDQFTIKAPAPGMVIYKKEWSGQKRTVGSEINPWDPAVATLPDLSTMISRTYVNEIDISKIKEGQTVDIQVDAFPEKSFTGYVYAVANVGEQLPNTDAKVFEVSIELNERDTILLPSMTTSNHILTNTFENVLYIPLEAVRSNDSLSYVYTRGREKQIVVLGESNENDIIVEQGLKEGDKVFLSTPEDAESFSYAGLELIEVIKKREAEKAAAEKAQKLENQQSPKKGSGSFGKGKVIQN